MRLRTGKLLLLATFAAGPGAGAAPPPRQDPPPPPNASKAAPSYYLVARAIDEITRAWDTPGATVPQAAPGWRAFFGSLRAELDAYAAAPDEKARLGSLGRIHQMYQALGAVAWEPASRVRSALGDWLGPRVRVAWAERRLIDFVKAHRGDSPGSTEHAQLWEKFVGDDIAAALTSYETAKTVQARRAALKRLTGVLAALRQNTQNVRWPYSDELQAALDSTFNRPNLDVSADVASLMPFLSQDVVQTGPIARNGYVSMVTAGPRTGFGLLPSDDGIAFFNSQMASTYTPITDFQDQLMQDRQGRKVAKLYTFAAQSYDTPNLTITAVIRPSTGLSLAPAYAHSIGAAFEAYPNAGKGLGRAVLAVIGLNRDKLTQKVGQQAYPRIAQGVVQGAQEEAADRIPVAEAQQNDKLRKVLVGNNTVAVKDYRITELSLRSLPTNALVSGKVGHAAIPDAVGADMPQPPNFYYPTSGVSADVHLVSILSNVVAGLLQGDDLKSVDNLMLVTKSVNPGAPPSEGITVGKNVDFPTFLKNIDEARAANNPKVTAIRLKKPTIPPEFSADDRGFLVVIVKDFQLDVPAPAGAERGGILGGPAKILRFVVPTAEFVLSYQVAKPANGGPPTELDVKVEDFIQSGNSRVQTLFDDESKPGAVGPFQANIAIFELKRKLQQEGKPIKVPLTSLNIPGFNLTEVSPLDPSGWMRVVLSPNGQPVRLGPQPTATAEAPAATGSTTAAVSPNVAR